MREWGTWQRTPDPMFSPSNHKSVDQYNILSPTHIKWTTKLSPLFVYPAGQTWGKTEGNVPADARAAAAGREVSSTDGVRAREREAQTHRLHEQEWRLHQPAGAGAGEVMCTQAMRRTEIPAILSSLPLWSGSPLPPRDTTDGSPGSDSHFWPAWLVESETDIYLLLSIWIGLGVHRGGNPDSL